MPNCAALILAFGLVATVRAIPVDEVSARIVGGPSSEAHVPFVPTDCTGSSTDCKMSAFSKTSPFEIPSDDTGGRADLVDLATVLESGAIPGGSRLSEGVGEVPENDYLALIELHSDNNGRDSGATVGDKSWLVD